MGLGIRDLITDIKTMGLLFENLCIRDLRIYTGILDGQVYHYMDRNDLECNIIWFTREMARMD